MQCSELHPHKAESVEFADGDGELTNPFICDHPPVGGWGGPGELTCLHIKNHLILLPRCAFTKMSNIRARLENKADGEEAGMQGLGISVQWLGSSLP